MYRKKLSFILINLGQMAPVAAHDDDLSSSLIPNHRKEMRVKIESREYRDVCSVRDASSTTETAPKVGPNVT